MIGGAGPRAQNRSMLERMIGAAMLNRDTYEEVEHDRSAIWQAVIVVMLVSVSGFVGGLLVGETDIVRGLVFGVIRGLISWALWALGCWLVGTTILNTPDTRADWGELARGNGFAQTPGIFNVVVAIPFVGWIILILVFVWQFVCMLTAVQASLDYNSIWRAFFVVLIALIPVLILNGLIVWALGIGQSDADAAALILPHVFGILQA